MAVQELLQNEYFVFFIILLGTLIVAKLLNTVLRSYVGAALKKTKMELDDEILGMVTRPLSYFVLLIGFYFALGSLSMVAAVAKWVDGIFFVFVAIISALLASRIFVLLTNKWLKVQKKYEKTPKLIGKIVTFTIYLIVLIIILGYFEVEVTPLVATLGLGGLAIGLALQRTLADFFSGVHIISDRPINVGDFIELDGGEVSGFVEDIGWRSTRVRTLPNNLVIVPNSRLAEGSIMNASMPEKEMGVVVTCGVSYESDLKKVEKVTLEVATQIQKKVKGAVKKFKPLVRYKKFGDSNIEFSIILRVEDPVMKYVVVHEFIKALKARYDKEKIEISWPVRKIYSGEKKTKSRKR